MNDTHAKQSIVVDYELPEPPAKVWRALTDPALLEAWLMPNNIRAEVGHRFIFQAPAMPGWDGVVDCEVLEVVPERRLVYSWRGGSIKPDGHGRDVDTVVTWELNPKPDGGTLLRLEHSGFDPDSFAFKALNQGWRGKIAARIALVLSTSL